MKSVKKEMLDPVRDGDDSLKWVKHLKNVGEIAQKVFIQIIKTALNPQESVPKEIKKETIKAIKKSQKDPED